MTEKLLKVQNMKNSVSGHSDLTNLNPFKFAGNLLTNCFSAFGHFVGLTLKGLISFLVLS